MNSVIAFLSTAGATLFKAKRFLPIAISITTEITKFTYNYYAKKAKARVNDGTNE